MWLYISHIIFLVGLAVSLKQKYRQEPLSYIFIPGLLLKLSAGAAYNWLYLVYYGNIGDSLNYFYDACKLSALARVDFFLFLEVFFQNKYVPELEPFMLGNLWEVSRNFTTVKLVSIFNLLTGDNFWISGFYFSFLSFWGMWLAANELSKRYPSSLYAAAFAFLCFPSMLLFSSGLTKESLAMAALCFLVARLLAYQNSEKKTWGYHISSFLLVVVCVWTLNLVRFYYLIALAICVGTLLISQQIFKILSRLKIPLIAKASILLCIVLGLLALAATSNELLYLNNFFWTIVQSHNLSYIFSEPENLIHYTTWGGGGYITLDITFSSILPNVPMAFVSALFRPFIWEVGTDKLKIIYGLENTFMLLLSIWAVVDFTNKVYQRRFQIQQIDALLLLTVVMYLVVLLSITALATPNLGSLARYRVGAYPFFVYLVALPLSSYLHKKTLPKIKLW